MTHSVLEPPAASASTDAAPHDIRTEVTLLRNQVDILQIQAAERKRPWHRQPSTVMSLIALTVSVTFSSLGVYFRLQDKIEADKGQKVSRVRENVAKLAEMQLEQGEAFTRAGNNAQMASAISSAFNARRQLLIEETESLIDASSQKMTSALYLSFAHQLAADARVDDAARYYRLALDAATTDVARSNVHRGFAMSLMTPGPQMKLAEAREHWRAALSTLARTADDYSIFLSADNLRVWGLLERSLGSTALADSVMKESRNATEKIVNPSARAQMRGLLSSDEPVPSMPGVPITASVMGDWQVQLADGRRGMVSLTVNTFNQMWIVQMSVTDGGRVVESRQGFGPPTDGSSVLLTWQGQRYSGALGAPVVTNGTLRLRRVDAGRLVGTDEVLGRAPVAIELTFTPVASTSVSR